MIKNTFLCVSASLWLILLATETRVTELLLTNGVCGSTIIDNRAMTIFLAQHKSKNLSWTFLLISSKERRIIWLTSREHEKIITEIAELGGKYKSAIPYTAIINKGNRIMYQRTGYSGDYNTYAAWIEKSLNEKYVDPSENEIPPSQWEFISLEK